MSAALVSSQAGTAYSTKRDAREAAHGPPHPRHQMT